MMYKTDERVFEAVELLILKGVVNFQNDVWREIGIKKQAIAYIRSGKQHFRIPHIERLCRKFGFDANWIFGLTEKSPSVERLKQNPQTNPQTKNTLK